MSYETLTSYCRERREELTNVLAYVLLIQNPNENRAKWEAALNAYLDKLSGPYVEELRRLCRQEP